MKLILTGATGCIGQEVLRHCLKNPAVTSLVVLSRRALPDKAISEHDESELKTVTHDASKLKTIILEDFSSYPDSVLLELAGADACIWSLGDKLGRVDPAASRRVNVDFIAAAAEAFATARRGGNGKKLRFVYGESENGLLAAAKEHEEWFEAYLARTGPATAKGNPLPNALLDACRVVRIHELAAALVKTALSGNESQILGCDALIAQGRAVLAGSG
ncbi:MAG: hypothetical protein M1832_001127 [Thelocarpon impressellum]|nr:MAG: hypothetical protein M1832_001127 [Thelocarpon impressellum]